MESPASSRQDVNESMNGNVSMGIPILVQATAVVSDGVAPVFLLLIRRGSVVVVHPSEGISLLCLTSLSVTCVESDRAQISMTPPHRRWTRCVRMPMMMSPLVRRE